MNVISAGISKMPPIPTAPIRAPTMNATGPSQIQSIKSYPEANAVRLPVISAFNCFMIR